jgi:hypothetical protein
MKNTIPHQVAIITATGLTLAAFAGDPFDLFWNTIDGGGVMRSASADGVFELSGTIGQFDAGPGAPGMTGGNFTLTGGFWFETPPGDCNADGVVEFADHAAFVDCLTGPAHDGIAVGEECRCFDVNGSGTIDLADFAATVVGYTGG